MSAVSIRTRHFCRVMLHRWLPVRLPANCFNPHPAFLPGDAPPDEPAAFAEGVSIRTRHFCRVMRSPVRAMGAHGPFQSAPGISAG